MAKMKNVTIGRRTKNIFKVFCLVKKENFCEVCTRLSSMFDEHFKFSVLLALSELWLKKNSTRCHENPDFLTRRLVTRFSTVVFPRLRRSVERIHRYVHRPRKTRATVRRGLELGGFRVAIYGVSFHCGAEWPRDIRRTSRVIDAVGSVNRRLGLRDSRRRHFCDCDRERPL